MALIEVNQVVKDYKINQRKKGVWGSIINVFSPSFKMIRAVNDISFSIEKGEMVGFIGPNGAGKSTTIKMLSGILYPTAGSITVAGLTPYTQRQEHVKRIGVVFGQRTQLWWDLPVIDTFDLLKYIYRIPDKVYENNMELFNELLGLKDFSSQPVRQLSLGQRMRADIAAALIHNPEIVFFDEPTIGLDVVAKEKIRGFIREMNKEKNTTMLFTTHDMQDIEKTCNRMIIIDKGIKIYDGNVEEIKKKYGRERSLIVEFNEKYQISIPGVQVIDENENKKRFIFDRDSISVHNLISDLTSRYSIIDLTIKEPEIESIIREIYEGV
jgi:ABC-2 type transport system ATP-binding protein